jgi:hypothetical protein
MAKLFCVDNYLTHRNSYLIPKVREIFKKFATNKVCNGKSYANRETPSSIFQSPPANLPWFAAGSSIITAAVALVDRDMLTCVRDEMDYPIDVCRLTIGE